MLAMNYPVRTDFMTHDSLKTLPFHLLYLNPHHYPQPGSSEVVVNYDLQSVIIIKLCSADASLPTPAASTQHKTRGKGSFHRGFIPVEFPENIHPQNGFIQLVTVEFGI